MCLTHASTHTKRESSQFLPIGSKSNSFLAASENCVPVLMNAQMEVMGKINIDVEGVPRFCGWENRCQAHREHVSILPGLLVMHDSIRGAVITSVASLETATVASSSVIPAHKPPQGRLKYLLKNNRPSPLVGKLIIPRNNRLWVQYGISQGKRNLRGFSFVTKISKGMRKVICFLGFLTFKCSRLIE